jgi:fructokinase
MTGLYGGIEAGGTKFVCAIGDGLGKIHVKTQFPTTTPDETIQKVISFFKNQKEKERLIKSLGIGSFGPLDPHPGSDHYGYITSTPKPGWSYVDIVGKIRDSLSLPVGFDTDVNAAALSEARWGAAMGLDNFIYLTIGTGIGGGGLFNGKLAHGLIHPEMGHILLPHDRQSDPFPGICPYHGDCFEGLASGPALMARYNQPAEELPPNHPAWTLEALYVALALSIYICILSPQRIVLGGGVMHQNQLFPMIRDKVQSILNGYIQAEEIIKHIDNFIVPPGLGSHSGVLGAIALAMQAAGSY